MEFSRKNPYRAAIRERYRLNSVHSHKETYHVVVDLGDSGIEYTVGDSIGIFARHSTDLVNRTLTALGATGEEILTDRLIGEPCQLREILSSRRNITILQRKVVQLIAAGNPQYLPLLDKERLADLRAFLAQHQLWDAVQGTPIELQALVDALPPLLPRLYSIASSQKRVGREVHLTVALTQYETGGILRSGVASSYLCHEAPVDDRCIPIYLQTAESFRLPQDTGSPVIMIGPGTGIAPFRAFLQEREATGARGKNWLFFGERNRAHDFLYSEDLLAWKARGMVRLDLAFSRDQDHKIYVQHRLAEQASDVWNWIQQGAHIYVCGDAEHMAPAVEAALLAVFQQQGGFDPPAAVDYLKALRKDQRYQKDCY